MTPQEASQSLADLESTVGGRVAAPPVRPVDAPVSPEATVAGRRAAPVAEGTPAGIDTMLRRVAKAGGIDIGPALEPVIPRSMTGVRPAFQSLEDELGAMARQAEAGVPLREMQAAPPPEDLAILYQYQGGLYNDINEYARKGTLEPGSSFRSVEEADEMLGRLDREIARAPTEADQVVYRGIGSARSLSGDPEAAAMRGRITGRLEPGGIIRDPGYSSTSPSRDVALGFTKKPGGVTPTMLEIEVPKGSRAARIPDENMQEHEILLPRDSSFEVLSVRTEEIGGQQIRIARVRLLPDAPPTKRSPLDRTVNARGQTPIEVQGDEILAGVNPQAAKLIDAARKEASARAEVVAMFDEVAEPAATSVGRKRKVSKTLTPAEIEAAKARGEIPGAALPTFDALKARSAAGDGALEIVVPAREFAERGWGQVISGGQKSLEDLRAGLRKPGDPPIKRPVWSPSEERISPIALEKEVEALAKGKRPVDPFSVEMMPDGRLVLVGDRPERFAAWLASGRDVRVRVTPFTKRMDEVPSWREAGMQPLDEVGEFREGADLNAFLGAMEAKGDKRSLRQLIDAGEAGDVFLPKAKGTPTGLAAEIVEEARRTKLGIGIDERIAAAFGKPVGNMIPMGDDIAQAAQKISAHEEALADLVEAAQGAGIKVSSTALERTQAFRAAQAAASESQAATSARTAKALETQAAPTVIQQTGGAKRALELFADVGAGLEVLKALGISVPDIEKIPVIGPVLGWYLKARAAIGIYKRAGGAVPRSAEAVVAGKAARTRDRVQAAVGKMLETGSRAAGKAKPLAGALGALGYTLFNDGQRKTKASQSDDPWDLYRARMEELARAAIPGAIEKAVAARVPVSDSALANRLSHSVRVKLAYVDSKAPRPPPVPAFLQGDGEWRPSKERLASWARVIQAAEDPVGVLEDAAAGKPVSLEAAETLKQVYPALFQEARMELLRRAPEMEGKAPYSRRVAMSILFDVPADSSMRPEHIQFLQQGNTSAQQPAQGSPAPSQPPAPTVSAPIATDTRTMTALDRRASS